MLQMSSANPSVLYKSTLSFNDHESRYRSILNVFVGALFSFHVCMGISMSPLAYVDRNRNFSSQVTSACLTLNLVRLGLGGSFESPRVLGLWCRA